MKMNKGTRKARLKQAVRVLEGLPRENKINMDTWRTCRMIHCVGGWIGSDPWFTRRGLSLQGNYFVPSFRSSKGYFALAHFFGLSNMETYHLFDSERYPPKQRTSKAAVVHRFKMFIKNGRAFSKHRT